MIKSLSFSDLVGKKIVEVDHICCNAVHLKFEGDDEWYTITYEYSGKPGLYHLELQKGWTRE